MLKNPAILDTQPYAKGKSMRIPYCPKVTKDGIFRERSLIPTDKDVPFSRYLITYTVNLEVFKHGMHTGKMVPYYETMSELVVDDDLKQQMLDNGLVFKSLSFKGDYNKLSASTKDNVCAICKVRHDKE